MAIMMANGPTPENMSTTVSPSRTRDAILLRSLERRGLK